MYELIFRITTTSVFTMTASMVYCALVLFAMVYGEDGIHLQSDRRRISHHGNPYEHLLPAGKDGQTCMPGSEFKGVCLKCFCSEDGTEIICSSGLCPNLPRHRRDIPVNKPRKLLRSESCTICTCEFDDFFESQVCSMTFYEVCPRRNTKR